MNRSFSGWTVIDGALVSVPTPYPPIYGGKDEGDEDDPLFAPAVEAETQDAPDDDEPERDADDDAEKPEAPEDRLERAVAESEKRENARAARLMAALKDKGSADAGQLEAPEENPFDLHAQTKQYLAWERKQAVKEALAASRAERVREREQDQQTSTAQAAINERWRGFKTASSAVLRANRALGDGNGGWKPEVVAYLQPIVHRMTREGSGSGEDGTVTVEDIEHEL